MLRGVVLHRRRALWLLPKTDCSLQVSAEDCLCSNMRCGPSNESTDMTHQIIYRIEPLNLLRQIVISD